ncbi:MAG TPA: endonuclease III, partial [Fusobacterium sp.]|uniref:endonuclease III domain-containing protein n=1 Tax=Fusobacterium sp. TaxID=68766 RepID=UPI002F6A2826
MDKKQRVREVLKHLEKKFGKPKCALDFKSPFELLVAVILSAQCTDVRVNIVTKQMFPHVNTPEQFASMEVEEIENWIRSTGFYHN